MSGLVWLREKTTIEGKNRLLSAAAACVCGRVHFDFHLAEWSARLPFHSVNGVGLRTQILLNNKCKGFRVFFAIAWPFCLVRTAAHADEHILLHFCSFCSYFFFSFWIKSSSLCDYHCPRQLSNPDEQAHPGEGKEGSGMRAILMQLGFKAAPGYCLVAGENKMDEMWLFLAGQATRNQRLACPRLYRDLLSSQHPGSSCCARRAGLVRCQQEGRMRRGRLLTGQLRLIYAPLTYKKIHPSEKM